MCSQCQYRPEEQATTPTDSSPFHIIGVDIMDLSKTEEACCIPKPIHQVVPYLPSTGSEDKQNCQPADQGGGTLIQRPAFRQRNESALSFDARRVQAQEAEHDCLASPVQWDGRAV